MANITRQYWKSLETAFGGGEGIHVSDAPVVAPVNLLLLIDSLVSAFQRENSAKIELSLDDAQDLIPEINADEKRLAKLFNAALEEVFHKHDRQSRLSIHAQRLARKIRIRIGSDMLDRTVHNIHFNPAFDIFEDCAFATPDIISNLDTELGTRTRLKRIEDAYCCELIIPINAGVAMPEPSKSASDVIRIHKLANGNCGQNPISRIHKAG